MNINQTTHVNDSAMNYMYRFIMGSDEGVMYYKTAPVSNFNEVFLFFNDKNITVFQIILGSENYLYLVKNPLFTEYDFFEDETPFDENENLPFILWSKN